MEFSVKSTVQTNPKMSNEDDTLLDTKEAAALIKYEVTSIYGLVKRKKIPFCKIEGKLLFSRRKLIEWIEGGIDGDCRDGIELLHDRVCADEP